MRQVKRLDYLRESHDLLSTRVEKGKMSRAMAGRWRERTRRKLRKGTWEICHVCPFWSHWKWVHLIRGHRVIGASHTWALRVIYSKCVYGMVMIIVIARRCCGPSACPAQNLYGISTCCIQLPSPPLPSACISHSPPCGHMRSLLFISAPFAGQFCGGCIGERTEPVVRAGWGCQLYIAVGLLQDNRLNLKYVHHNYLGSMHHLVLPWLPHGSPSPLTHRLFYWLSRDVHMWA